MMIGRLAHIHKGSTNRKTHQNKLRQMKKVAAYLYMNTHGYVMFHVELKFDWVCAQAVGLFFSVYSKVTPIAYIIYTHAHITST